MSSRCGSSTMPRVMVSVNMARCSVIRCLGDRGTGERKRGVGEEVEGERGRARAREKEQRDAIQSNTASISRAKLLCCMRDRGRGNSREG